MPADPRNFLPLRPVDLVILITLLEHEHHGYGLAREIAARTEGVMDLGAGNLYRVIKRLVDDGLVAVAARPVADSDDERRVYYGITRLGTAVAALEAQRLRTLLASAPLRALVPKPERA